MTHLYKKQFNANYIHTYIGLKRRNSSTLIKLNMSLPQQKEKDPQMFDK